LPGGFQTTLVPIGPGLSRPDGSQQVHATGDQGFHAVIGTPIKDVAHTYSWWSTTQRRDRRMKAVGGEIWWRLASQDWEGKPIRNPTSVPLPYGLEKQTSVTVKWVTLVGWIIAIGKRKM